GRAGEGDARAGAERLDRARLLRGRGLDRLRLVEDGERPLDLGEPGDALDEPVGGEGHLELAEPIARRRELVGPPRRPAQDGDPGVRREAVALGLPVSEERRRDHEQAGAATFFSREKADDLDRLAETHVVGEADAETEAGGEVEPADADLLVRPELGGEA